MAKTELIHGDRRFHRRYSFEMAVRFSYRDHGHSHAGTGSTVDLSSGGIRFLTDTPPPAGVEIEMRVAWPFLLQNVCPMELVVWGTVVRADPQGSAVLMRRHEFRTCGARSFDTVVVSSSICNYVA